MKMWIEYDTLKEEIITTNYAVPQVTFCTKYYDLTLKSIKSGVTFEIAYRDGSIIERKTFYNKWDYRKGKKNEHI